MAVVIRCEMCGGELEIKPGEKYAVCKYCKTKQTIYDVKDENEFLDSEEECRKEQIYRNAYTLMNDSDSSMQNLREALCLFVSISDWGDAGEQITNCKRKMAILRIKQAQEEDLPEDSSFLFGDEIASEEDRRKQQIYQQAFTLFVHPNPSMQRLQKAQRLFESISDWRDAEERVISCKRQIAILRAKKKFEQDQEEKKAPKPKTAWQKGVDWLFARKWIMGSLVVVIVCGIMLCSIRS